MGSPSPATSSHASSTAESEPLGARSPTAAGKAPSGEIRKFTTLLKTSQALSGTLDLRSSLQRVLEILGRHHGAVRSTVALLREGKQEIAVEVADGPVRSGSKAVRYQLGEGITGRVVESGKAVIIPRVSREPMFLHRAAEGPELSKQELSYISVPIVVNRRTVGALGVDLKFKRDRDYDRTVKFLGIVASMIAQAIKMQRLIESERKRLVDENTHLRQELKERSTSRTSSGRAARCARSTSRSPRSPGRTRRCCCAASQGPARS